MRKILLVLVIMALVPIGLFLQASSKVVNPKPTIQTQLPTEVPKPVPPGQISLTNTPRNKILEGGSHVFETFNNCGPATLSMALSYYGIKVSQQELGQQLRPYQHPKGDNDDKSTTFAELAEKSKEYGFVPYHRPLGNPKTIKLFITYNIPVITKTLTKPNEDIAHYRLVKGFDDNTGEFIQDDSLQNKNLRFTYSDFDILWKKFNYEYLVLVPKEKNEIAKLILGEDVDPQIAWNKAVQLSLSELEKNPNDTNPRFNLSIAYYNVGNYQGSAEEFEKVEHQLPFRTLWYQIEPIKAYFELNNYARVFELSDRIFNNRNKAFSELYILRGEIYKKQGNIEAARQEFEKAVFYNTSLQAAKDALNSI